jgi:malate synthase
VACSPPTFEKDGKPLTRRWPRGSQVHQGGRRRRTLHGRSLLLVRNVGIHMTNEAVLLKGEESPEGILDAVITSLASRCTTCVAGTPRNSRTGSIYIVKPKMHGPEEVAFTCEAVRRVEDMLGLARNTLKIGIMDEERRTTVNLKAASARRKRARLSSSTPASSTAPATRSTPRWKPARWCARTMKQRAVDQGLRELERRHRPRLRPAGQGADRQGHVGQAGPDMRRWSSQDRPPQGRRDTAWVPSPTAATLHAMHYHEVNVWPCRTN